MRTRITPQEMDEALVDARRVRIGAAPLVRTSNVGAAPYKTPTFDNVSWGKVIAFYAVCYGVGYGITRIK